MAKNNVELNALEIPKSRSEAFLDYICGRAQDINSLPIPKSRVEEYLEYLCYNRGQGGGGGGIQLPIPATDVIYDNATVDLGANTVQKAIEVLKEALNENSNVYIEQDKNGLDTLLTSNTLVEGDLIFILDPTDVVDFNNNTVTKKNDPITMIYNDAFGGNKLRLFSRSKEVEDWEDLNYVTKYPYSNLLDNSKIVKDKSIDVNTGDIVNSANYGVVEIDVKGNTQYTYFKRNIRIGIKYKELNENGQIIGSVKTPTSSVVNNYLRHNFTTDVNTVKVVMEVYIGDTINSYRDIFIEGDINEYPTGDIPFTDGELIQIGTEISYKFDNTGSNLVSTTYESAIKEINSKVITANDFTNTGGPGNENKPVKLDATGKLNINMISEIAINRVLTANDKQGAIDLIDNVGDDTTRLQVGDVVVVTTPNKEVYMYNGQPVADLGQFDNGFIQLSFGDGTVRIVNGQTPAANGEVTVNASQINMLDNTTVEAKVNAKVTDVRYDATTKMIQQTKDGQVYTDITEIITKWEDLQYVTNHNRINIADRRKIKVGYYYGGNGTNVNPSYQENPAWSILYIDITRGQRYTLYAKTNTNNRVAYIDDNGRVLDQASYIPNNQSGNYYYGSFNSSNVVGVTRIAIQFENASATKEDFMLFEGNVTDVTEFIPYKDGENIQIGTQISYAFDNTGSGLTSTTVESAIKELANRPQGGGTITSINGQDGATTGGQVTLTANVTNSVSGNIVLEVGNQSNFATLECMTDQQADDIINGWN